MKRTITSLAGLGAAATLFLAGCGSDTTGASVGGTTPAQASSTSVAKSSDDATSSADDSTSEDTSSSDDATSSTDDSTSDGTSSSDDATTDSRASDTSATTTVGSGGDLDETSVTWFDTYCGGVSPALEEVKNIQSVTTGGSSDPQAMLKKLGPIFTTMGKAFTQTAKDLDGVPAPTFDGGDTLATTVVKAMNEYGPKFTELGTELSKGDSAALSKLQDMGKDMQGLQDLAKFKVDDETLAAIKQIPSCKPLFSMGG